MGCYSPSRGREELTKLTSKLLRILARQQPVSQLNLKRKRQASGKVESGGESHKKRCCGGNRFRSGSARAAGPAKLSAAGAVVN